MRGAVAIAIAGVIGCAEARTPPAPTSDYCPTLDENTRDAFVVHGAKVLDAGRVLEPADVLVASGEIVAVGATLCFRARPNSVAYVDGVGATLVPGVIENGNVVRRERIAPGDPADLVLVTESGAVRSAWRRGVLTR